MKSTVQVPRYWVLLGVLCVFLSPVLSFVASIQIADRNAEQLVKRYERDQAASRAQNRAVYCSVFSSQLDAFDSATTPTGQASRRAWLDLYELVDCQPERK